MLLSKINNPHSNSTKPSTNCLAEMTLAAKNLTNTPIAETTTGTQQLPTEMGQSIVNPADIVPASLLTNSNTLDVITIEEPNPWPLPLLSHLDAMDDGAQQMQMAPNIGLDTPMTLPFLMTASSTMDSLALKLDETIHSINHLFDNPCKLTTGLTTLLLDIPPPITALPGPSKQPSFEFSQ